MMFEYITFKESLAIHSDQETQKIYTDYISIFGDNPFIENQPFFSEFLSLFDYVPYRTPLELSGAFDWDLLQKLITGSFSTEYTYVFLDPSNSIPDLKLSIDFNGSVTSKTIEELTDIQIFRIFEILIVEQMSLAVIAVESLDERKYIIDEREQRMKQHIDKSKNFLSNDEFTRYLINEKHKIKRLLSLSIS